MTPEQIRMAAALLIAARRRHRQLDSLPDSCRPASAADAYAIQDAVVSELGPVAGWKTGSPGPDIEPIAAPLAASAVFPSGAALPASGFHMIGIEAEIAFRIGRDLPPRAADYERDEVAAAVASLHPAIEVVDSRLPDWDSADAWWRLADNQTNGAFVYGDGLTGWRDIDPVRQPVALSIDGAVVAETVGGNPAGDLLRLLAWVANHCARRCGGLRSGDIVTTGSCTGLIFTAPGAAVVAHFPGIGEARVDFPT